MLLTWFPILVTLAVAALVVGGMVTINRLTGPRRPSKIKGESFECGNPPSGAAWGRFSVHFYLTAMLFVVFDVEVVFLYPWAVELRVSGCLASSRCWSSSVSSRSASSTPGNAARWIGLEPGRPLRNGKMLLIN